MALDIGLITEVDDRAFKLDQERVICLPLLRSLWKESERNFMLNGSHQLLDLILSHVNEKATF